MMEEEEEEEDGGLYQQLHKLSSIKKSRSRSDEEEDETDDETTERVGVVIEDILLSLWNTRKTGLSSPEKSRFQSLLHLPSLSLLDPVLACLRSLMRKYVHENMNGDDLLKLFPPHLPIHLQSILLFLFHKHQPHWRRTLLLHNIHNIHNIGGGHQHPSSVPVPVLLPPPPFLEPVWPRHNGSNNILGASSAPLIPHHSTALLPLDDDDDDQVQGMLPRLKSMTWSMEKGKSGPANKVAVITLKLQDYTNSTSGEMEVKFRLTRETLEAMLRSMTYISEQLSSIVGSSSGPVQKKQRQSDHIV